MGRFPGIIVIIVFAFVLSIMLNAVHAAPDIEILSPLNTSYSANKILINVSANETVDFYMKGLNKNVYVAKGVTSYQSYLYGKTGIYNLVIYANNSNGVASKNVSYTITQHNPVNVTTGGRLISSNTEYVVANDISGQLVWFFPTENITVDLNGHEINGNVPLVMDCSRSKVFNGKLTGLTGISLAFSYGCLLDNLTIDVTDTGVELGNVHQAIFNRINMKASVGFWSTDFSAKMTVKNSILTGYNDGNAAFLHDTSGPDRYTLEYVNITNFTKDFLWQSEPLIPEYTLRNTVLRIDETGHTLFGAAIIYKQHLAIINTTDDSGNGVPIVVEIKDNTIDHVYDESDIGSNPTASLFVATNESGIAETWLTEKVSIIRIESPMTISEHLFSPYNVTARSRDVNKSVFLNAVGNSTFRLGINITFPSASLPACTIDQMLDLNNDGVINSKDALVVLRRMVGKEVSINITKNCNAISFFPVN